MQPYERLGKVYNPIEPEKADNYIERGIASWYGDDFHNYKTSTGEIYNMYDMTAAHKTLPLGIYVRVKNLKNKKECIVRLNDRGPFVDGRIIDLSYKAALELDMVKNGTAPVEIEVLGFPEEKDGKTVYLKPSSFYAGTFSIQIAAFKMLENAERLKNQFLKEGVIAKIVEFKKNDELFFRVRIGEFKTIDEAKLYQEELKKMGYKQTYLVGE
ncbi:MAG: septal ring lytic transglycosylase RlpA family protein [Proteobacteria bacterium]|nr:septal ring lytic transglycosylase RlpA family protein [Pseudomonadota bacterium]